jgi:tRNA modification GTPase
MYRNHAKCPKNSNFARMQQKAWDDSIIALATPPGVGALGIIRLSGPQAIAVVNQLFPFKNLELAASHTLHVGWLVENEKPLDEVVISIFKAPRSYTGENVVEISCHGSPYIQQQVMEACIRHGARVARPGEFTQRAFLMGKMDLAQAEAVADVIASNTAASQQTALNQMRGGFSHVLSALREELIRFSALIELELDFATEDVEFADRTQLRELLGNLQKTIRELMRSFALGNVIKNGVQVAIIGKPNAGKSTLLNTLLNEERAIVSDIPGTTRDTIEETLNINGILFRLVDTAGIRHSKGDVIEDIGIERSKANAEKADIVIHLSDINDDEKEEIDWLNDYATKTIEVKNKLDVWQERHSGMLFDTQDAELVISARNATDVEKLKTRLYDKVMEGKLSSENSIVTNARHYAALAEVDKSLQDIQQGLDQNIPSDLIALDIRRCLHFLGEITGQITHEDQLDYIFSKFCIGK